MGNWGDETDPEVQELKEYQACYYRSEGDYNCGDMRLFKSFDTAKECNDYIDQLNNSHKRGFIQLLLKSDWRYAEDFKVGTQPIYHN